MFSPHRLEVLDVLRGLAAIMVALFHYTGTMDASGLRRVFANGCLGVDVFFVISGMIIPYSMWRSGYRGVPDYGRFLWKRILRLYPAYLISMIFTMAIGYAATFAPGYSGVDPNYSWHQILMHVPLLAEIFRIPWIAAVFWTLAIELQYYLFIGLAFPLFQGSLARTAVAYGVLLALALLPLGHAWLIPFLPLFLIGIATFLHLQGHLTRIQWICFLLAAAAVGAYSLGWLPALVGVLTSLAMVFGQYRFPKPLIAMGTISYSFYLIHSVVGNKLINLSVRLHYEGLAWDLIRVLMAFSVSASVAWVLYYLVERPSQKWSSTIKFRTRHPQPEPARETA